MGSRKEAEEPEEQPSRAAGACVLVALAGVVVAALFAISDALAILVLVAAGVFALWRSVRRTANPAPPPPPESGSDANPQFTVTEDRPGHCTVTWHEEVTD
ncbi:hypothetical protein [Streptomyces sp. NPDC059224]|uniref:hypothetical protein n=1 Tax=Streptomyces sp. NPDC059224 TaxID=3346775 RepID=UPI0036A2AD90